MTHSVTMSIILENYEDVKQIWERIYYKNCDKHSILICYKIMRVLNCVGKQMIPAAGLCPHIYFPDDENDKEKDGRYYIFISTSSHCSWYDTDEILFCWTFWYSFKKTIDSYGIKYKYYIVQDSVNKKLTLRQAFKKILVNDEDATNQMGNLIIKKR